jgi:hypothetical protein
MTQEQKDLFVSIMQMGWACGLEHPYECLVNFCRTLDMWTRYEDMPKLEKRAHEAFVAFLRGTKSCPEDTIDAITVEEMNQQINDWYRKGGSSSGTCAAINERLDYIEKGQKPIGVFNSIELQKLVERIEKLSRGTNDKKP